MPHTMATTQSPSNLSPEAPNAYHLLEILGQSTVPRAHGRYRQYRETPQARPTSGLSRLLENAAQMLSTVLHVPGNNEAYHSDWLIHLVVL